MTSYLRTSFRARPHSGVAAASTQDESSGSSAPVGCEHCGDVVATLNPIPGVSCPCACHLARKLNLERN